MIDRLSVHISICLSISRSDIPTVGSLAFASGNRAAAYAVPYPAQDGITEAVALGVTWFATFFNRTGRFIRYIAIAPLVADKFEG